MVIIRQDFLYGVGKRAWNSGFTGGMGKRGSVSLPGLLYTAGGLNFYGELMDDLILILQIQSRTRNYSGRENGNASFLFIS